jgi:hypothetical protein
LSQVLVERSRVDDRWYCPDQGEGRRRSLGCLSDE